MLSCTRSAYWDAVYSGALQALLRGKWQPTGPFEKIVRSAIDNAKKTVRRRASKMVAWADAADQVAARDTTPASDAALETFYLLKLVSGRDRAIICGRLASAEDAVIAESIGVPGSQVPLLYHRAVRRLREKVMLTA
jgi:DNA-directed RNA polymerase specialized sigma24 family protein